MPPGRIREQRLGRLFELKLRFQARFLGTDLQVLKRADCAVETVPALRPARAGPWKAAAEDRARRSAKVCIVRSCTMWSWEPGR